MSGMRQTHQQGMYVAGCGVSGGVLGVPAGIMWPRLSDPPSGVVSSGGVFFGESELNSQVGVTLWFLVGGALLGLVAGLAVGWLGSRRGMATVFGVLALAAAACSVSYWTGVHVFGPDQRAQLATAREGSRITAAVGVDTFIAFLGWPIGALTGGLAAMAAWPRVHTNSDSVPVTRIAD